MLHVTTGCMYSGKTNKLIQDASGGGLVIDYDTQSSTGIILSHSSHQIPCVTTTDLWSLDVKESSVFINEAQFFDELVPFVKHMLLIGKTVHVYGLDGDYHQEKFGSILDLIPMADTYTKLYATCEHCGKKASFSKRLSMSTDQYRPHDSYIPVCRACLE